MSAAEESPAPTTPQGWALVAPGVWSRRFGAPEGGGPLDLLGSRPAREALEALDAPPGPAPAERGSAAPAERGSAAPSGAPASGAPASLAPASGAPASRAPRLAFPLEAAAIRGDAEGGRTVLRFPLPADAPVLGLGLQFSRIDHRGRTRFLRVNSDPKEDTGETHAPVPLCIVGLPRTAPEGGSPADARAASAGPPLPAAYGVLVNTARIVTIHCGSTVRRSEGAPPRDRNTDRAWSATPPGAAIEIVLQGPGAEVLVLAGPTPLQVIRRYNLLCGGGCLPPRWGLGFWHRTPTKFSADEVLAEAAEYRRRGFPCDVIGLEPGWHSASYPCTFEWSPERFPDPADFVSRLAADGFRVNLWEHPWVSPQAPIHPALQSLSGSHTVWGGLAPDQTLPAARAVLSEQHQRVHLRAGVSGYKLDECDGSELTRSSWMFPAHARFPSGRDGEELRQVYGLLLQQWTAALFRARGRRTYGLVRASGAGAPPLPYALYTDLYDHRGFVRALCNGSLSGLLFAPEVRSARDAADWVRRIQTACFSPLAMLNAWSAGTKPWSFPEVEGVIRAYLELRQRLLPYFYTAFARYRRDGTPPFRAMALEPGGDAAVDDQYMAGDDLLVAPLFATGGATEEERQVRLPPGDWYDFATGERFSGPGPVTVRRGLAAMALFVRDGGIVPLQPPLPHAPRPGAAVPLEVRHYGRQAGRFLLYDDDGETLAHEEGAYRFLEFRAEGGRGACTVGPGPEGLRYGPLTWRFLG